LKSGAVRYFKTVFLEEVDKFIKNIHPQIARKIFYNVDLAEQTNDPRLLKKIRDEIWEFRVRQDNIQIRLLAFWDKRDNKNTLILVTHGLIKKGEKVPGTEIDRAKKIRSRYFESNKH
jgi:phage-related protein